MTGLRGKVKSPPFNRLALSLTLESIMGTTLDYSPASWHIVANGANIDAEHRVTREKFSGTVAAFNAMVKAKGYPGIDAIDSIIENPRRVPVTALLSDVGVRFDPAVQSAVRAAITDNSPVLLMIS